MEFLVILSAILSAVTGVVTGVRGPEARLHHEAAASVVAVAASSVEAPAVMERVPARAPVASRPEKVAAMADLALPPSIPLYVDRLIE